MHQTQRQPCQSTNLQNLFFLFSVLLFTPLEKKWAVWYTESTLKGIQFLSAHCVPFLNQATLRFHSAPPSSWSEVEHSYSSDILNLILFVEGSHMHSAGIYWVPAMCSAMCLVLCQQTGVNVVPALEEVQAGGAGHQWAIILYEVLRALVEVHTQVWWEPGVGSASPSLGESGKTSWRRWHLGWGLKDVGEGGTQWHGRGRRVRENSTCQCSGPKWHGCMRRSPGGGVKSGRKLWKPSYGRPSVPDQDAWPQDGETLKDRNWGVTYSDFHFSFHSLI